MDNLDIYRSMPLDEIMKKEVVKFYMEILKGKRKSFPKGTLENKENIILIFRYAVERVLELNHEQIPLITTKSIKDYKLFGLLNHYRSIPKLIKFVYKNHFDETDFQRVTKGYWSDTNNIKKYFEQCLQKHGYTHQDIPQVAKVETLVSWGFSNPLKRYGHSPLRLINALYPDEFNVSDFESVPQRYWNNPNHAQERIMEIIHEENIPFKQLPVKVTQEMLIKYGLSTLLKKHNGSPSQLLLSLFPSDFSIDQFRKTNRYWKDIHNVKNTIDSLLKDHNIPHHDIPKYFTKSFFREHGLYGLIQEFNASPIELVNTLYPGQFEVTEFQRVPNRYWYSKENRIQALRSFCEKRSIPREDLPTLTRAYFKKVLPRFISLVDRQYDSKFHLWITEAFPEYTFSPEEFKLLVGVDGQLCDSMEEMQIHNFLCGWLQEAEITREKIKFNNPISNEGYYPDWIISLGQQTIIVEYFGLYHSNKYKGYKEKTERKIDFYRKLEGYAFLPILPEDFKDIGFEGIKNKFKSLL
ncbi:hypothetical protein [Sutcliffiella horikoshii]|uniref:DUF4046 domain-containing protein n=1 Tax=Sutcliffiella horikoshii TaxID=79883 RepID=A0A5D4TAW6_9BACI|nr:hypothetical protein [Sutcliffiella horikoshii]TYS72345.1 hypothetical protein FZC75_10325 [Sutcliffiella horikoshii]